MTTESKQDTRTGVSPLLGAAAAGLVLVGVLAIAGGLAAGGPGLVAAAAGGGLALVVLGSGTAVVHVVSDVMPSASLLVALLTYTLQVVLMALVALALVRVDVGGQELSRGWFAGSLIAVTALWMAVQVWLASRVRIPAYDLPSNGSSEDRPGGES